MKLTRTKLKEMIRQVMQELDVRKTYGDKRILNPETGEDIKLRTALKYNKSSPVYQSAKQIYNQLKDS